MEEDEEEGEEEDLAWGNSQVEGRRGSKALKGTDTRWMSDMSWKMGAGEVSWKGIWKMDKWEMKMRMRMNLGADTGANEEREEDMVKKNDVAYGGDENSWNQVEAGGDVAKVG